MDGHDAFRRGRFAQDGREQGDRLREDGKRGGQDRCRASRRSRHIIEPLRGIIIVVANPYTSRSSGGVTVDMGGVVTVEHRRLVEPCVPMDMFRRQEPPDRRSNDRQKRGGSANLM